MWCGNAGRFLMTREKQHGIYWIEGGANEDSIRLKGYPECDATGETLIVYTDPSCSIKTVNLADRMENFVATYKARERTFGCSPSDVVPSPDMKHAAVDAGRVEVQSGQINGIAVSPSSGGRFANSLLWSRDSSRLFNIMTPEDDHLAKPQHHATVQVIDIARGTDMVGDLPGFVSEKGVVLQDGKELLLFLRPSINDISPDPGSVFACKVAAAISCRPLITNVDQVSFSDHGMIATVKEIYKDPNHRTNGDANVIPIAFVVDVRSADGKVIASQRVVTRKGGKPLLGLRMLLSPSGAEAAVIREEWCAAPEGRGEFCSSGSIVQLDGRK
jgi:hypothetical protein